MNTDFDYAEKQRKKRNLVLKEDDYLSILNTPKTIN